MYAHKRFYGERLPLFHDGFIGLGNCKMTLIDQWIQQKLICQNIVSICIAKVIPQRLVGTRVQIDCFYWGWLQRKIQEKNLAWEKLIEVDGCVFGVIYHNSMNWCIGFFCFII